MGVTLTAPGEALIARLQAQGQPLNIDTFLFALVEGQDHTQAPATTGTVPEGIVHTRAIPPEYRAYVNPNQVVYSALLGSDVGDFAFNWQGLYCSEHSTLIAVATFPALQKRAYNPGTNSPGNNLTRNFMLEFSGAQTITQITLEASVWQLDFTHRLKGMDERERMSNRDIYGRAAFLGDGWLLQKTGSAYAFAPGSGYVEGIRAGLDEALPALPDTLPCEVFLDVCMDMQGSDRVALAMPVFVPEGIAPHDYSEQPPSSTRHYRERIAHIAADGTVTDWRGRMKSALPEGGEAGDLIIMGEDGEAEWGAGIGVGADGTVLTSRQGKTTWEAIVASMRNLQAGSIRMWPSLVIPTLEDGLPLGLSLDGAVVSLATYPRLARVACPAGDNAWAPAWYRCNSAGTRDAAGTFLRLDDWRGGFPQALDLGRGNTQSTVLVKTTSGSAAITVVNNLSDGGTLLVPKTSTGGIYPGLAVSGAGIPAGAKVASVSGTTVTLTVAATATAASVEMTVTGRVLGSWQWDGMRNVTAKIGYGAACDTTDGAFYTSGGNRGGLTNSGWPTIALFDASRVVPIAPQNRPAGPVAHYIILV